MAFSKERSAGYLTNHAARLFAAGLARRMAPLGLAPAQFMVLLELWEEDGQTQARLVNRLDVEQATMANTLARMERDGLITRLANKADKRSRLVFLTNRARELREPAIRAATDQNNRALAGLSQTEGERFLEFLNRVIANMKRGQ